MPFDMYPPVATDPDGQSLPIADSDEPLDVPVTIAPSLDVLADWIAWLRANGIYYDPAAPDIQGPINVIGDLSATGAIHADGALSTDTTLDVGTDVTIGNDLTVGGAAGFAADLSVPVGPVLLTESTLDGPNVLNGDTQVNGPFRQVGGYRVFRRASHGSLGAPLALDLSADIHTFGDPSIATVDVDVDAINVAVGTVLRLCGTATAPANEVVFRFSATPFASFPGGSLATVVKPWIEVIYNGLNAEIIGHGGGAAF